MFFYIIVVFFLVLKIFVIDLFMVYVWEKDDIDDNWIFGF